MESKHTPGPWKVVDWLQGKIAVKGSPKDPRQYRADTPQSRICEIFMNYQVGRNYSYTDEDRANAQLIAAAPELLDALQIFVHQYAAASLHTKQALNVAYLTAKKSIARAGEVKT